MRYLDGPPGQDDPLNAAVRAGEAWRCLHSLIERPTSIDVAALRGRLAVHGLAGLLRQGPRAGVRGDRGARTGVRARARLPAERRRAGAAARGVAGGRAARARHDQPVLQPRAARRAAGGGRGRLHRDPRRHPERPALGVAVVRGAAGRARGRLSAVRGHRARRARPRRERRADGDRGAAPPLGALRRRGRREPRRSSTSSSSATAASATSPPPSARSPSSTARRHAGDVLVRGRARPGRSAARADADHDRGRPRQRAGAARRAARPPSSATTT